MPPKKSAGQRSSSKAESEAGGKKASVAAALPVFDGRRGKDDADADFIPALVALPGTAANPRRAKYANKFKELTDLILSSDATYRLSMRNRSDPAGAKAAQRPSQSAAHSEAVGEDYFPTLQVAFMARAMGLNVTEEQVVQLVQLVESDVASRGSVSRRRLEGVVIDALMTGILGGPTLVANGVLTQAEFPAGWKPSCCLRSGEDAVCRAFAAIDTAGKGFLTVDELRMAMTTMGDPLSTEEMDEMLVAFTEPGSDTIYYQEFVDLLVRD